MNKKIIIILIIALAVAALVFLFVKEKQKKKKEAATGTQAQPLGGAIQTQTQMPNLATQGINGGGGVVYTPDILPATTNKTGFPLGVGSKGVLVQIIQAALNLKADGIFGAKTEAAVKAAGIDVSNPQTFADKFVSVNNEQYAKNFPLKKGSKNNYVKAVQIALGLKADGIFGAKTEAAVKKATGKTVLYHADYTSIISTAMGGSKVTYNGKQTTVPKTLAASLMAINPALGSLAGIANVLNPF